MKVNKRTILKWTKALRSGKYKQTTGALQDGNGFCCLGVACDVFIPKMHQEKTTLNYLAGELPEDQFTSPQWLKKINRDLENKTRGTNETLGLVGLNDSGNYNFNEIADTIEAVYIHGALD